MKEPFNKLRPAEVERLAWLLEELGEAQQAIGKILRHGWLSRDPTKTHGSDPTNTETLEVELADVVAAIRAMCDAEDLGADWDFIVKLAGVKRERAKQWMHHQ